MRRLGFYAHVAPVLLRVGIGLTFFFAGLGKVLGGTEGATVISLSFAATCTCTSVTASCGR